MEQFLIYLWSISENLQSLFIAISFLIIIIGIPARMAAADDNDEKFPLKDVFKILIVGGVIASMAVFMPSKQDLALIFAYPYLKSGAQQAVQSESMKKILTISNKYLDKVIIDLEKEVSNDR